MKFQYISYIWPLIISAVFSFSLGIYALLRRRNSKGSKNFILSMFVVTIWSLGNAMEMSSVDFSTKLFWANIQYFAYGYSPVTLLALCMQFTGYDRWVRNRKILWIAVVPTIIIILVWTDGIHGLVRYDMKMDYSGMFPVIEKKYGPFFYIHGFYSHSLNIFAWVLLIKAVFFKNTVYRKQAAMLLVGISLIVLPNILYITGLSPVKRFDITPLFFGPAGLFIAWGIFRFKLFDVIPVARATVIETMEIGVMVLDLQDRVLDINPFFQKIIGWSASKAVTRSVEEVCGKIPDLVKACLDRQISHKEFLINTDSVSRIYEIFLSPLTDHKGVLIGRLIVAYDITEKKQEQIRYLKQQRRLAVIKERESNARDMHDNLGQVLGFINLQAQGIRQELLNAGVDIVSDKLDKMINATQSAHKEIRESIRNARSSEFLEKDFILSLTSAIESFEEQTNIEVKMYISDGFTGEELKPNTQINILYIIKEALANIRKHANASYVEIAFLSTQDQLSATIEDNGKGFDIGNLGEGTKSKFGISIMRERASEIGAQIDIETIIEKGTRIVCCIPMGEEEKIYENEIDAGR
ncbi:histidine kinase N-terminal 7TM domain-containing protein [Alkaliphilus peptidifermentans]|uniref:histidine kinase n=1 Tax=Alkaliphilus peptidifermentans DSM 18978 TaxID=1120976 RepID=A0A1G5EUI7_9FIRM|nr:histidine kinase N-terminal 7TM domain-containing protein [Alkaliphilus peptidifermentans]SCY30627.1 PAS domain S-box-containing protein [Alkaliphilus peptidifermentans DSM 18978]